MWLEVMTYHRATQGRRNVAGGDDISYRTTQGRSNVAGGDVIPIELLKAGEMWLEVMTYQ